MGAPLVMMLGACNGDGSGGPYRDPSSRLGLAGFRWGCAGVGDLGCSVDEAFPRTVALGSSYEPRASATSRVPEEVSVSFVQLAAAIRAGRRSGNEFEAVEAGLVTLMAIGPDGEMVDYTEIEQVPVASIDLVDANDPVFPPSCDPGSECFEAVWDDPPGPLSFVQGQTTEVRAEPHGGGGEHLMGHLSYAWEVTPPSVATLGSDDTGNVVDIDVLRVGQFQVRVTAGGVTQLYTFGAVSEGPTRRRPEPGGSGGETDTDTDGMDTDTDGTTAATTGGETGTTTGGGM